jgi:1-pyrroline-5-carboxylate dehydrogenase
MNLGTFRVPVPVNEPVKAYAPGSAEREGIKKKLAALASTEVEVPVSVGGKALRTGNLDSMWMPHDRRRKLGVFHQAGPKEIAAAIDAAEAARPGWAAMPFEERAAIRPRSTRPAS